MNRSTSFLIANHKRSLERTEVFDPSSDFLILQKIAKPFVEVQPSKLAKRKAGFNFMLLNDFTNVSEIRVGLSNYQEPVLMSNFSHFMSLLLANSGINHINIQAPMLQFSPQGYFSENAGPRKRKQALNWGFKKKKGTKLSLENQQISTIDEYLDLSNVFMRICKLSSINWSLGKKYAEATSTIKMKPIYSIKFARHLPQLTEFCLEGSITTTESLRFLDILQPYTNINIQLSTPLKLRTLVLDPFEMTPQNTTFLFDLLRHASQLKTFTIGIRGPYMSNTKLDVKQISLPTNLSVEELTLTIWNFKTDKELTTALNLFLGSIEAMFPSLKMFSLRSNRDETDYQKNKKPSALKLGTFLKNLQKLKNLQTLYIESDICKGLTIDSLEGCSALTSLKIVTNPLLETAKLKGVPHNVTDLNLSFQHLKYGVQFAPGHQQIISDYFNALTKNKIASDNIQVLTLFGYDVYPKTAGLLQFSSLRQLNIIDGRITEEELSRILNGEGLVSLKELNLSRTLLLDSTLMLSNHRIFTVLENTKAVEQLEMLDLSEFRILQELQAPKDSQKFKNLRKLDIKKNELKIEGLRTLIHAKFPKLEELNIEYIEVNTTILLDILMEKIKLIDHMKYIYLSENTKFKFKDPVTQADVESRMKRFHKKSLGHPKIRVRLDANGIYHNYLTHTRFMHFK